LSRLIPFKALGPRATAPAFVLSIVISLLLGCAMPASHVGMIPPTFDSVKKHPQSVRVSVTGGQETEAVGRPHIPNSAFAQALVKSIVTSQTFSRVVEGQSKDEDYLLTVTIFSLEKLVFGRTVKLEAGWTLRRAGTSAIVWQESITSEFSEFNVQLATEGAARNNIAQALAKISRLNL
jgi:hypothetical protein